MTPPAPDLREALSFMFRSWPLKTRAMRMLAYYDKHPGLWKQMHPDAPAPRGGRR